MLKFMLQHNQPRERRIVLSSESDSEGDMSDVEYLTEKQVDIINEDDPRKLLQI